MRILVVSQYFPPEGPAAFYAASIAQQMALRGHEVRVLTGFPNYPTGQLFPGYVMKGRQRESAPGVEILRVPLYLDHSQSAIRRMVNYVSFGISSALAARWGRGADVVYVYATQLTAALGPWLWRLTGGPPYVLHIQDLWPDSILGSSLVRSGRAGRVLAAILNPWIASVYRHAAAVVGIAPTMVAMLVDRGVPPEKAKLVFNWADEQSLHLAQSPSEVPGDEQTRVLYAGNVGDLQDLETAVEAAHRAADAGVRLTILGDGVALPRVRALVEKLGSSNIDFRPAVPRSEMADAYRRADFALVCLKDLPVFRGTIPSKLQAALSHGMPIVTTVQGDVRDLVEQWGVGFTADAESPASLEAAFRAAAVLSESDRSSMSALAAQAYVDHFSLQAGSEALEQILLDAASWRSHG